MASLDGDADIVPFFVGLTVLGGVQAVAVREPFAGVRVWIGRAVAITWAFAAAWIGALLVMYQAACGCSMPLPAPEATYLGLTATVYHLAGTFGGGVLVLLSAFLPAVRSGGVAT
jgi:hypothetical protein